MYKVDFSDMSTETLEQFKRDLGYASTYGPDFLNPNFNNNFWADYKIVLLDEPNFFDMNIAENKLKYYIIKSSKYVANSFEEINPESLFYIEDTLEKAKTAVNKGKVKQEAYTILSSLSADQKIKVLKVYGEKGSIASEERVSARIFELIEENPSKFISICRLDKEKIAIKTLIFDLIEYGVIRERNNFIYDSDELVGSMEEFEYRLIDPKNTDTLQTYKERLEAKRK